MNDTNTDREIGARLKLARMSAGYRTAQSFAATAGVSQGGYSLHENGRRGISDKRAQLYADLLGVDPSWIKYGRGKGPQASRETGYQSDELALNLATRIVDSQDDAPRQGRTGAVLEDSSVPLLGVVQAGAWREGPLWGELPDDEIERYSFPKLPAAYSGYFAVEVRGDSMDIVYPEGSILVCLPLSEFPRDLRNGDHVIVERHENGTVETTVKAILLAPGGELFLTPRSNNPRYNSMRFPKSAPMDDTGMPPVRISAVVVASYTTRPIY